MTKTEPENSEDQVVFIGGKLTIYHSGLFYFPQSYPIFNNGMSYKGVKNFNSCVAL